MSSLGTILGSALSPQNLDDQLSAWGSNYKDFANWLNIGGNVTDFFKGVVGDTNDSPQQPLVQMATPDLRNLQGQEAQGQEAQGQQGSYAQGQQGSYAQGQQGSYSQKLMNLAAQQMTQPKSKLEQVGDVIRMIGKGGSLFSSGSNAPAAIALQQEYAQNKRTQAELASKKLEYLTQLAGHAAQIEMMKDFHNSMAGTGGIYQQRMVNQADINTQRAATRLLADPKYMPDLDPNARLLRAYQDVGTRLGLVGDQQTSGPIKGTKKIINGRPYTSDGTQWVKD